MRPSVGRFRTLFQRERITTFRLWLDTWHRAVQAGRRVQHCKRPRQASEEGTRSLR